MMTDQEREAKIVAEAQQWLDNLRESKGIGYASVVHAVAMFAGVLNELHFRKGVPEWVSERMSQVATVMTAEITDSLKLHGREKEIVADAEELLTTMNSGLEREFPEGYKPPDESAADMLSVRTLH